MAINLIKARVLEGGHNGQLVQFPLRQKGISRPYFYCISEYELSKACYTEDDTIDKEDE